MSAEIVSNRGGILTVKVTGWLTPTELLVTQQTAADILRVHGGSRVLVAAEDFQGWEKGGDWGDMSGQMELDAYAQRIAIVGDRKWKDLTLLFTGKGVRHVAIEYFSPRDVEKARAWLARE